MGKYGDRTDFLFARPSFLEGVASALDIGGTLIEYNQSQTPLEADRRAISSDWAIVGQDIQTALETIGKQEKP